MFNNNLLGKQCSSSKNSTCLELSKKILFLPSWIVGVIALIFTGSLCYKIIITDFKIVFDFSSFLSLILALFSIFLAALFYFKATDTSNAFYDNTYKFTQDMAQLLSKIESGFGEKLKHLDDSYKGMMDQLVNTPNKSIKETVSKIESKEEAVQQIRKDMDLMIHGLIDKAGLGENERREFLTDMHTKEHELAKAESLIKHLRHRLECEGGDKSVLPYAAVAYLARLIKKKHLTMPNDKLFDSIVKDVPKMSAEFLRDLKNVGFVNGNSELTAEGKDYIRNFISNIN